MLLALIAWFHSCTVIQENTLQNHKTEIIRIVELTCPECVVLWPVKAEGNKVALSVISVITGKARYQTLIIDFDTMDYVRILTPKTKTQW